MKSIDLVKSSILLKKKLKKRFENLNLTYNDIIIDAEKHDMKLSKSNLSTYFNKKPGKPNYPTQRQILWLAFRYCIITELRIKDLEFDNNRGKKIVNQFRWNKYKK